MKIVSKNNIIALIGVLIVFGVAYSLKGIVLDEQAPPNGLKGLNDTTLPADGSVSGFAKIAENALYVAEQRPGMEVIVNVVAIGTPGYIAIHELRNGQLGGVIGVSPLLTQGSSNNVRVLLVRPTLDGEELIAMLHTEKGVMGFDPSTDLPLYDQAGNIIHMVFPVSAGAIDPSTIQIMF